MEVSDVRRRIRGAVEDARRRAGERRARTDSAARAYGQVLETIAVPAFHMLAQALTGEGYRFNVLTPGQAVRLSSERSAAEFIELSLDTDRDEPAVVVRATRGRGRRMTSSERILCEGAAIANLTDEDIVAAVTDEVIPFVER